MNRKNIFEAAGKDNVSELTFVDFNFKCDKNLSVGSARRRILQFNFILLYQERNDDNERVSYSLRGITK